VNEKQHFWMFITKTAIGFLVVGVAFAIGVWIEDRMGWQAAMLWGGACILMLTNYASQFLTMKQVSDTMQAMVQYNRDNVQVEAVRGRIQLEHMKQLREVVKTDGKMALLSAEQIDGHVKKLSGIYSKAEIQALKEQMYLGQGKTTDAEYTLE